MAQDRQTPGVTEVSVWDYLNELEDYQQRCARLAKDLLQAGFKDWSQQLILMAKNIAYKHDQALQYAHEQTPGE